MSNKISYSISVDWCWGADSASLKLPNCKKNMRRGQKKGKAEGKEGRKE